MAKDYLKNEIGIGDEVIFCELNYRELTEGIVIKITPQKVRIKYTNTFGNEKECLQFHNQVIKKPLSKISVGNNNNNIKINIG